jgi:hypothetical protein
MLQHIVHHMFQTDGTSDPYLINPRKGAQKHRSLFNCHICAKARLIALTVTDNLAPFLGAHFLQKY